MAESKCNPPDTVAPRPLSCLQLALADRCHAAYAEGEDADADDDQHPGAAGAGRGRVTGPPYDRGVAGRVVAVAVAVGTAVAAKLPFTTTGTPACSVKVMPGTTTLFRRT
jgi:hypothetical protein